MLCSHCGRSGHEKRDCWQIIGFPEWWPDRNNSGGRGRGGRNAGSGGSGRGRAQATAAHATTAHATSSNTSSIPGLTSDQWKILTKMIQEKSGSNSSDKLSGKKELGDVILIQVPRAI